MTELGVPLWNHHLFVLLAFGPNDVEREHIIEVLEQSAWVIEGDTGPAAVLGLAPSTLGSRQ